MSFTPGPAPYKGWPNPSYAFDKRRGIVERGLAQQVQISTQVGTATVALPQIGGVSGVVTSEATVSISFPYTFIEKPVFNYGWELAPNNPVPSGQFHSGSATVHDWTITMAGYTTLYWGCDLDCVNSGPNGLVVLLHYTFIGRVMSGLPTPSNDTGNA